jgi:hypothetical protein
VRISLIASSFIPASKAAHVWKPDAYGETIGMNRLVFEKDKGPNGVSSDRIASITAPAELGAFGALAIPDSIAYFTPAFRPLFSAQLTLTHRVSILAYPNGRVPIDQHVCACAITEQALVDRVFNPVRSVTIL